MCSGGRNTILSKGKTNVNTLLRTPIPQGGRQHHQTAGRRQGVRHPRPRPVVRQGVRRRVVAVWCECPYPPKADVRRGDGLHLGGVSDAANRCCHPFTLTRNFNSISTNHDSCPWLTKQPTQISEKYPLIQQCLLFAKMIYLSKIITQNA